MPTLLDTQRAFAAALRAEGGGAAADLIAPGRSGAGEAIAIYRNTFISGAVKALRLSHPAVERLTGAEFFDSTARDFVAASPPSAGCLDDYGAGFAGFLKAYAPLRDLPYVADVARLDWAVNLALHADDAEALEAGDFAAAAGIAPARLVLVPHPSLSMLRLDYPADAIWRAVLAEKGTQTTGIGNSDAGIPSSALCIVVWRNADGVQVRRVSETGFAFLSALCAGRSFAETFDASPSPELPVLLAESIAAGRFAGFMEI